MGNRCWSRFAANAQFWYDADGVRVKGVVNGVATVYVGDLYEEQKQGGVTTKKKYLLFNGRPVAVEVRNGSSTSLYYLLTDHLGSTSLVLDQNGAKVGEVRYKAWGETRYSWGTVPTSVRYTGQRQEAALGIYYYRARWYDPALGRFLQPDTIVPEPGKGQAFNVEGRRGRFFYKIQEEIVLSVSLEKELNFRLSLGTIVGLIGSASAIREGLVWIEEGAVVLGGQTFCLGAFGLVLVFADIILEKDTALRIHVWGYQGFGVSPQ